MASTRSALFPFVVMALMSSACSASPQPTRVDVVLDGDPRLEPESLEVRVWNTEGERVLDERELLPHDVRLPVVVPLVPEGDDASRSWALEAVLRTGDGATHVIRARGGYEEGKRREVHRCFEHGCGGQACGEIGAPFMEGWATCRTDASDEAGCFVVEEAELTEPGEVEETCPCDPSPEESLEACHDGRDNDCDGKTDCEESSCIFPEQGAACHDTLDNDCDGDIDCDDPDCADAVPENTEALCGDGVDNDCDDKKDCKDDDCDGFFSESSVAACHDGIDNNCDDAIDCDDPDCLGVASESSYEACHDGVDNDCDGDKDCDDSDCQGIFPPESRCDDYVDNDCNNLEDCDDPACEQHECAGAGTMCCGGDCEPVWAVGSNPHCGRCRNDCAPYRCGRIFNRERVVGAACKCGSDSDCPGDTTCAVRGTPPPELDDSIRCNCWIDNHCGPNVECVNRPGFHNYCRAE